MQQQTACESPRLLSTTAVQAPAQPSDLHTASQPAGTWQGRHGLKLRCRLLFSSPATPHGWGCAPAAVHAQRDLVVAGWAVELHRSSWCHVYRATSMACPCLSLAGGAHEWQVEARRKAWWLPARGGAAVDCLPDPLPLSSTSRPPAPRAGHHSVLLLPPQPGPVSDLPLSLLLLPCSIN
jgi:hypothetical protein